MSGRLEGEPSSNDKAADIDSLNLNGKDEGALPSSPKLSEEAQLIEVDEAACERLKELGNGFFKQGKIAEALEEYRKALLRAPIKKIPRSEKDARFGRDDAVRFPPEEANVTGREPRSETIGSPNHHAEKEGDENQDQNNANYILTSQVFCNAGLCLMKLGEKDEAIEMLSEAIRHQPSYAKAFLRRAEAYFDLEKWPSAFGDYESYEKLGGVLLAEERARKEAAKVKVDEEVGKTLSAIKDLGNRFLGNFGLSTDNFKFDKDPKTGGYSMRFER
ncbi:unnamed protein product [Phytomonas sp. EM1]|nr:unnamed protein product [Phytomonas sp. EM1]|eukprot:CCW60772.1 unnamed protein product [Phytomonas sp. isolate EM1]